MRFIDCWTSIKETKITISLPFRILYVSIYDPISSFPYPISYRLREVWDRPFRFPRYVEIARLWVRFLIPSQTLHGPSLGWLLHHSQSSCTRWNFVLRSTGIKWDIRFSICRFTVTRQALVSAVGEFEDASGWL